MTQGERELRLFVALLEDYVRGQISVGRLASRSEELIDALVNIDPVLAEELRELWLPIEIAYAMALNDSSGELSADQARRVDEAVDHLRAVANRGRSSRGQ